MFYAFSHAYGVFAGENGNDIGRVHIFATAAERAAWLAQAEPVFRTKYTKSQATRHGGIPVCHIADCDDRNHYHPNEVE